VEFPGFVTDRKIRRFFKTGHKLFFGLLLAVVIVWTLVGLLSKWMRKK